MGAKLRKPTSKLVHTQTLTSSSQRSIDCIDMRIICTSKNSNKLKEKVQSVLLICGEPNGCLSLYQSLMQRGQRGQFILRKYFRADDNRVQHVNIHCSKPLFVSASHDGNVKVWNYYDTLACSNSNCTQNPAPHLIKCLSDPNTTAKCAKYSNSGLLLTVRSDHTLRIYGKEPLFSLCYRFEAPAFIYDAAWSPSNQFCASFRSSDIRSGRQSYVVQVWDSSFQLICKFVDPGWTSVLFASNTVALSWHGYDEEVNIIAKPNVMKVFVENDLLPFCRDVLKIVIQYLPLRVTHEKLNKCEQFGLIHCVAPIGSGVVCIQGFDNKLRLYKVDGNGTHWLVNLPHNNCCFLRACVYPCMSNSGKESELMIASVPIRRKRKWRLMVRYFVINTSYIM